MDVYLYGVNYYLKINNQRLSVYVGIAGALCTLYGLTQSSDPVYFVLGSSCMLITALYFNLTYFIALELILIAGHGAILLGIGPILQVVLPILLSLQIFIYYLLMGELSNVYRLLGIAGMALLSIGFSYKNQWIFFSGSLGIAIFSFYHAYCGMKIAWLWFALNTIFILIALYKIFGVA